VKAYEDGTAYLVVLAALLPLFLLAATGAFLARTDLLVAAWAKRERMLFYEAEGGMEKVLSQLGTPGKSPLPDEVFDPPWEDPCLPVQEGVAVEEPMLWTIAPLPDSADIDGDPSTPAVLFSRSFGYGGSPHEEGGYPVFEIELAVGSGGALKVLVAEATPLAVKPRVSAAWSLSGPVSLDGPVFVSGLDHGPDGSVAPDRSRDLPAFRATGEVTLLAGAGRSDGGRGRLSEGDEYNPPQGPLDVLDSGPCLQDVESLPPPVRSGELRGVACTQESYRGSIAGEGILIVHNPRFLPGAYEASRLFHEEGVMTGDYDPRYDHLDPDSQPALLEVEGGVFLGLVVADAVSVIDRDAGVTGALVTLSRSPRTVRAWADFNVLYSKEVLEGAGRGDPFCLLGFTPVDGPSDRLLLQE
jgi:hypothetical protein